MGEARRRKDDPRRGVVLSTCPRCRYEMDAATAVREGGRRPQAGDFSLCGRCGLPLRFDGEGKLVAATIEELENLDPHNRTLLMRAAAALGSQRNPIGDTAPGVRIAEVMWVETPGEGKGMMVRANGPAEIGLASVVLCQGLIEIADFDEPTKAAAAALVQCLTAGRVKLPPFEVYRSNAPGSSEKQ
jgi:hypothetical protein